MKEIWLILSGVAAVSQAEHHPRSGKNCLAESTPGCFV